MNTQIEQYTIADNPNVYHDPRFPDYDFIPSGSLEEKAHPYPFMGYYPKKLLFEDLWKQIEKSAYCDRDGYEYSTEWGVYYITAVHHYEVEEVEGGDSYCGIHEMVPTVVRDEIEIIEALDNINNIYCKDICKMLNDFGKEEKLLSNL